MRFRWLDVSLGAILIVVVMVFLPTQALSQGPEKRDFVFLDITDTHQTAEGSTKALRDLVSQAIAMSPRPAFVIDTGDITESGRPEEYAAFKEAIAPLAEASIKFYAVPGNHDVRWCPLGKEGFEQQFGKLYQSFDYEGVHFVLLDTTVLLEHWGHFDQSELDWLARDLKHVRPETPIFVFMHHWIGRDAPDVRMVDNEYDLLHLLNGHNVVAIFTGHGHQNLEWKTNGIETLMVGALYNGGPFCRVHVRPDLVTLERGSSEKPGAFVTIASLPINPPPPSQLRAGWDDPDVPYLARRRIAALLDPRSPEDDPSKESAEYRIDSGPYRPMEQDSRDIWHVVFPTAPIPVGVHSSDVRLTTSNKVTYSDELIFEVERDDPREPSREWAINLGDAIQSSPLLYGDTLYVSSLDHKVYALNATTGKTRWSFATKGAVLGSPVISDGTLYIGSTDHYFYALDTRTGKLLWHFDSGDPIFSTAGITAGVVCFGGNKKIFGLDAKTGKLLWTTPANGFFQSRVAADDSTFYMGDWANTFYAIDAKTGTPRWEDHVGRLFYFSPAISAPALGDGKVYVCSDDGVLHAFDTKTGKEVWAVHAPSGDDVFGYSSPTVLGVTIFVAGLGPKGNVYALSTANGQPIWVSAIGQTIYDSSPSLAPDGHSLAIMGVRGHVAVLNADNGKPLWSYELGPGNIFSTPAYDGKTVYTTTMADDVQAIAAPKDVK